MVSTEGAVVLHCKCEAFREVHQLLLVEGVENEEQAAFVRDCACRHIQGYYCSATSAGAGLQVADTETGDVQVTSFLLANACTGAFKMRSMKEKGGVCMRRLGIDVSEHNGILDWDAIKRIEFAIIRSSWDILKKIRFRRNVRECERVKMPYGLYHYSYVANDAQMRELPASSDCVKPANRAIHAI